MKKFNRSLIVIGFFIVATFFYYSCAHNEQQRRTNYPEGIVFNQPYDKVWRAVYDLIFTDLGCVEKNVNKKKGKIETDWVTNITTEGTMRWKITAKLKQQGNSTRVFLNKDVAMREEITKSTVRSKEKEKDQHPNAGWKNTEVDAASIDRLYQQLKNKLK